MFSPLKIISTKHKLKNVLMLVSTPMIDVYAMRFSSSETRLIFDITPIDS